MSLKDTENAARKSFTNRLSLDIVYTVIYGTVGTGIAGKAIKEIEEQKYWNAAGYLLSGLAFLWIAKKNAARASDEIYNEIRRYNSNYRRW